MAHAATAQKPRPSLIQTSLASRVRDEWCKIHGCSPVDIPAMFEGQKRKQVGILIYALRRRIDLGLMQTAEFLGLHAGDMTSQMQRTTETIRAKRKFERDSLHTLLVAANIISERQTTKSKRTEKKLGGEEGARKLHKIEAELFPKWDRVLRVVCYLLGKVDPELVKSGSARGDVVDARYICTAVLYHRCEPRHRIGYIQRFMRKSGIAVRGALNDVDRHLKSGLDTRRKGKILRVCRRLKIDPATLRFDDH